MSANRANTDVPADRLRPMNQIQTASRGEEQTVLSELTHQANSLFRESLYPPTTTHSNSKKQSVDQDSDEVILVDRRKATSYSAGKADDHLAGTANNKKTTVAGAIAENNPMSSDDLLLSKQTAELQKYSNRDERLLREQEKALGAVNNKDGKVAVGAIAVHNPMRSDDLLLNKQTAELQSYANQEERLLRKQEAELAKHDIPLSHEDTLLSKQTVELQKYANQEERLLRKQQEELSKHDAPMSSEDILLSRQTAELQKSANRDERLLRKQQEDLANHANQDVRVFRSVGGTNVAADPRTNDLVGTLKDLGALAPATAPGAVAVENSPQPHSDAQSGGSSQRRKRQAEDPTALNTSMTAPPRCSNQDEAKALVDDLNASPRNSNSPPALSRPGAYARNGPGAEAAALTDFQFDEPSPSPFPLSGTCADFSAASDPSSEGLAEARPVLDDEQDAENQRGDPTQTAKPVDTEQMERKATQATEKDRRCRLMAFVAIVCSIAIFAIIFVVSTNQNKSEQAVEGDGATHDIASVISSDPPSAAPTGVLDNLEMDLPSETIARMNNGSHMPQWKAWNWLSNHPSLANLPEWKRKQLFGLGTFFFAFGGENWPSFINERWLDYSKDECLWFSSGHGYFRDGEYLIWDDCTGTYCKGTQEPCNDKGEFTRLILWDMELEGLAPSIPPEIALLTSLSALSLSTNDINATLSALLPQELYQLTNLTDLVLIRNNLRGPIPSEIGDLTSLTRLDIFKNDLSGQVPSELGLMTRLEYFSAGRTDLTGHIPSELGLLTVLTHLHLHRNQMTGLVPSELGLLTAMEDVYLYTNNFSGSLPTELGSWEKARILRLSGNNFSGPVPNEFGRLSSLERLELSNNHLSGSIPNELGSISSLEVLQLHNNRLTGSVPEALNESVSMSLDGNQLTGAVPHHLCSVLWCDCSSAESLASTCEMLGDPPEWPGRYPQGSDEQEEMHFALNIHMDKDPSETEWYWQVKTNGTGVFQTLLDSGGRLELGHYLNSFILSGAPSTTFKLGVTDRWGDGLWAGGWITLTTANETVVYASEMNPSFSETYFVFEIAPDDSVTVHETHLA